MDFIPEAPAPSPTNAFPNSPQRVQYRLRTYQIKGTSLLMQGVPWRSGRIARLATPVGEVEFHLLLTATPNGAYLDVTVCLPDQPPGPGK